MKNRCVIQLGMTDYGPLYAARFRGQLHMERNTTNYNVHRWARVYGSHSEAKIQLPKWLTKWPDAKIVDAGGDMTTPLCETCDVPHSPPVVAENKCLIACRIRGSRWVDVDRCDDFQAKQRIWPVAKVVEPMKEGNDDV